MDPPDSIEAIKFRMEQQRAHPPGSGEDHWHAHAYRRGFEQKTRTVGRDEPPRRARVQCGSESAITGDTGSWRGIDRRWCWRGPRRVWVRSWGNIAHCWV